MADDRQLQTSRLLNTNAGNLIDDSFADLEAAVRYIFGITADTPYSQAMSIDASGNVTLSGQLTLAGAPTVDLHAATKKYVDDNTVAGGAIDRLVLAAESFPITSASETEIEWNQALVQTDVDTWSLGTPGTITIQDTGVYMLGVWFYGSRISPHSDVGFDIRAKVNAAYVGKPLVTQWTDEGTYGYPLSGSGQIMLELTAADTLKLYATMISASATGTVVARLWLVRIA